MSHRETKISLGRKISDVCAFCQTLAAFTATSYSFDTHNASTVWNLMDLSTGEVSLLYNGSEVSEMIWIGPTDTSVLYVNGTNSEIDGGVELWVSDTSSFDEGYSFTPREDPTSDNPPGTKWLPFQRPYLA